MKFNRTRQAAVVRPLASLIPPRAVLTHSPFADLAADRDHQWSLRHVESWSDDEIFDNKNALTWIGCGVLMITNARSSA
jgi:hypothetical protein